jgi:hypothetical protein
MTYANVQAAHDALMASLEAASEPLAAELRYVVIGDLSELTDPPAVALAPPVLAWEGPIELGPRLATWSIALVVAGNGTTERGSVGDLFAILPAVVDAVDGTADAVVLRAEPGVYRAGATELPAYFITAEVAL